MIDNFELIKPLLSFNDPDEFYFLQIIQRKKDNRDNPNIQYLGSNNSSRLIKAYYITSLEQLEKYKFEIIGLANMFNARVGINLNKRSFYKTAFNTLVTIANSIGNKEYSHIARAYNTCCGVHKGGDKIWLLDVDFNSTEDGKNALLYEQYREQAMIDCINRALPVDTNKILAFLPSKSGYHIITTGFDSREFNQIFPEVEIHRNNPVNLYIP